MANKQMDSQTRGRHFWRQILIANGHCCENNLGNKSCLNTRRTARTSIEIAISTHEGHGRLTLWTLEFKDAWLYGRYGRLDVQITTLFLYQLGKSGFGILGLGILTTTMGNLDSAWTSLAQATQLKYCQSDDRNFQTAYARKMAALQHQHKKQPHVVVMAVTTYNGHPEGAQGNAWSQHVFCSRSSSDNKYKQDCGFVI